jgi:ABC-type uncharacterized transport system permease subunit
MSASKAIGESLAAVTPPGVARRVRGMSDRTIAWLFITPTLLLLLAINIFPLIWALRLSFTNFRSNAQYVPTRYVGLDNYRDILTDPDLWAAMQVTAHFVFWSVTLEVGKILLDEEDVTFKRASQRDIGFVFQLAGSRCSTEAQHRTWRCWRERAVYR